MTAPSADGLARERAPVEAAIEEAVSRLAADSATGAAMAYAVGGGGKRLRPILCVTAWRALRGDPPPAVYRLAAALELIHSYSLAHDDLPSMDDDPVRRGRAAVHVAHGVATATLAGAALIPLAARTAADACAQLGLTGVETGRVVAALCVAAGAEGMVGGQMLDLEAEGRSDVTLDELERIHRLKTGALLAAAPVIGGLAAGADRAALDALTLYGTAVGLAFQITDDILDVTGSSAVLGKTAGRDRALAKATFPALTGLEAARERARSEVETALAALDAAGIRSPEMTALAHHAIERDR